MKNFVVFDKIWFCGRLLSTVPVKECLWLMSVCECIDNLKFLIYL